MLISIRPYISSLISFDSTCPSSQAFGGKKHTHNKTTFLRLNLQSSRMYPFHPPLSNTRYKMLRQIQKEGGGGGGSEDAEAVGGGGAKEG